MNDMSLAFLYAGQGSQKAGMGSDFYEAYPTFKAIFDDSPVSFDIKEVCFKDGSGLLNDTRYTQPAMVSFAVGITNLLYENDIRPDYAAGLSLGEYSALFSAGVFTWKTAVELAEFRGGIMYKAAEGIDCAMYAVLGMEREPLLAICEEARASGVVEIANYNCPGQLVISGETEAVEQAVALVKAAGKKAMKLKTSGPFHTSLLKPAAGQLAERFENTQFNEMNFPVLFNCTGDVLGTGETIPQLLTRQVYSSVYMEDIIRRMATLGVNTIIEIGPGKVLSGFVRKTAPGIKTYVIDSVADYEALLADFKGGKA